MLKICGINDLDFALKAEEYGVNFLGFIFFEKSPRFINIKKAFGIIDKLKTKTKKVGVFVDLDAKSILDIAKNLSLDVIQLHNDYSEKDINFLKDFGFEVWRVLYEKVINSNVDGFLIDKKAKNLFGGTGKVSDWNLVKKIKDFDKTKKIILSGGLGKDNIKDAYKLGADIFDINSSLEIEKGKKEIKLLEEFFKVWNDLKI